MALVGVPRPGVDAQGPKDADSAHPEDPLLLEAELQSLTVELARQIAVRRVVLLQSSIEEVDRDLPDQQLPGGDVHLSARCGHAGQRHGAVRSEHPGQRRGGQVEGLVGVLLPAIQRDDLVEVALRVEETHSDHRDAQVRRRLAVISGKNPEASGVDGDGVVNAELRAEVDDRPTVGVGAGFREPCGLGRELTPKVLESRLIELDELRVVGALGQPGRIGPAQQIDRVVATDGPQRRVDSLEELPGAPVPAPGEVHGELAKPLDPLGQVRDLRLGAGHRGAK